MDSNNIERSVICVAAAVGTIHLIDTEPGIPNKRNISQVPATRVTISQVDPTSSVLDVAIQGTLLLLHSYVLTHTNYALPEDSDSDSVSQDYDPDFALNP
jgi:hypothetical protein